MASNESGPSSNSSGGQSSRIAADPSALPQDPNNAMSAQEAHDAEPAHDTAAASASLPSADSDAMVDVSNSNNNNNNSTNNLPSISPSWLQIGRMVSVERRMKPGQNFPGGKGLIERLYTRIGVDANTGIRGTEVRLVDVKYLSCEAKTRDKNIPIEFVKDNYQFALEVQTGTRGKSRKRESRRCTRCLAFASDCANCDWVAEEKARRREQEELARKEEADRLLEARMQREKEELSGLEDSSDGEESSVANFSEESGDESSDDVDSEEDERRRAKVLNRHRKRDGKLTRRRRRRKKKRDSKKSEGEDKHDGVQESESEDEVPIAILQIIRKQEEKARSKKLHAMKLMMNKQDDQSVKKRTGKKHKKKRISRTRPDKVCALGSLDAVGGSHNMGSVSSETKTGDAVKSKDGKTSKEESKHGSLTKKKSNEKKQRRDDDTAVEMDVEESNTKSSGQKHDSVFDIDSDSSDAEAEAKRDNDIQPKENAEGRAGDEEASFEAANDFADSDKEDDNGENLLTPREAEAEEDSSSSDEDELVLNDLGNLQQASNEADANMSVDSEDGNASDTNDDNNEVQDEDLRTPRSMDEESDNAESSDQDVDDDNDGDSSVDNDSPQEEGEDGSDTKETVQQLKWGELPTFITDLSIQIKSERIPNAQNELSTLKRRLLAIRQQQQQASRSLLQTTTNDEMVDELYSLAKKRYVVLVCIQVYVTIA